MDDFDRFAIEAVIQSRARNIESIEPVGRDHHTPMNVALEAAERVIGRNITLFWIDDGLPGHFTISNRRDLPVIFHSRQIEWTTYLRSLYVDEALSSLVDKLSEKVALRLLADLLLCHGFVDQALQTLARSDLVASHAELSFPKIIPDLEYAPIDESYIAAWFHGLAHEAGHHVKPNHRKLLESLPFLKDEEVRRLVSDLIVHFYPDANNQKTLNRIVNRANTTPGTSSFAATAQIRDEAIADITAASILLETATDVFSQLDREPLNRTQLFCEIMLQMNCLMIIQQCNVLASWFSSSEDELENQNLILSNIALQARQNLLIRACNNAPMSDHLPDFSTVVASDGFESLMMTLSANSRKIEEGVWRARAFLSSPDMRDIEVFYAYVDKLPGDPAAAMAAKEFVRLADSMGRRSPELEMLAKAIGVELS